MSSHLAKGVRRLLAASLALSLAGCGGKTVVEPEGAAEPAAGIDYPDDPANLEVWLERLEIGSREIYSARADVAEAVSLRPGAAVADIGAGTGIYTLLFAEKVGPEGAVYAIDIEPRFLRLINQRAEDDGLSNVTAVLGREESITLPANSVDAVFICDTYHYFEDPAAIMATVRAALRPGGALYVVDYELMDGVPPPPDHRHVRFGRTGVAAEIESFGFEKAEEIKIAGLAENYMLRFRKPEKP
jgi:SAM-dependent methyltransferase